MREVTRAVSGSSIENRGSGEKWLTSEGEPLEEGHLVGLWKQYYINEVAYLDLHFKYANWYSAFFIALFAAYIVGLSQYYTSLASILFLALPVLVIVLAHLGRKAMDRFYRRFLEAVTMLAKLEKLLGLDGPIQANSNVKPLTALWPDDEYFIPRRHHEARYAKTKKSSGEFIEKRMKLGANRIVHNTFLAFQIIAAVLLFGGIVLFSLYHLAEIA